MSNCKKVTISRGGGGEVVLTFPFLQVWQPEEGYLLKPLTGRKKWENIIVAAEENCHKRSISAVGLVSFLFVPDPELWRRWLRRMQRLCSSRRATGDTSLDLPSLTQYSRFAEKQTDTEDKRSSWLYSNISQNPNIMKQWLFYSSVLYHGLSWFESWESADRSRVIHITLTGIPFLSVSCPSSKRESNGRQ